MLQTETSVRAAAIENDSTPFNSKIQQQKYFKGSRISMHYLGKQACSL